MMDNLELLYQTLVEPYLSYCCIVWASPSETTCFDRILKLQKQAVRIITRSAYRAHSIPLFAQLGILKVHDLCYAKIMLFIYKSKKKILPSLFNDYFTLVSNTHTFNTRSSNKYAVPFARTTCRYNCLKATGPRLWNSLPMEISNENSIFRFRSKIKRFLLLRYDSTGYSHCYV